jgi:hypothetical protein
MRFLLLMLVWVVTCVSPSGVFAADDPMTFWDQQRRGGNSFNRLPPDQAYFDALRAHGARWVRLSYDKWPSRQRDFLMGDADHYKGLDPDDLATLRQVLDRIERAGLKAVVVPLSLPFSRWRQNNGDKFDDRLWQERRHWQQAAQFWRDLAGALRGHAAVAGYNLINEPAPEYQGGLAEHASAEAMRKWYGIHRGGPRDLIAFYGEVITAVRAVDDKMPLMVDAGWYGAADAFSYWPAPLSDARVLYSFHMYEPFDTTSAVNARRAVPFIYPGNSRFGGVAQYWDATRVAQYLQQPLAWADAMGIARSRMVAGEFGCIRTLNDCARYLDDVLNVLEPAGVHWAFYAFREDSWDAMDYELGRKKVPWAYWRAAELGQPDPVPRSTTPLFDVIRQRLQAAPTP